MLRASAESSSLFRQSLSVAQQGDVGLACTGPITARDSLNGMTVRQDGWN